MAMRRTRSGAGLAVLTALVLAVTTLTSATADEGGRGTSEEPELLRWRATAYDSMSEAGSMADPAVVEVGGDYIAVATGPYGPRAVAPDPHGPWQPVSRVLATLPSWAAGPEMWAADLEHVKGRWLLYFSLPVSGLQHNSRCIGVAVGASPLDTFVPMPGPPLVCPRQAHGPVGDDPVKRRPLKFHGVIDPSFFRDRDGRAYLLYKTQGLPATIRAVPLRAGGIHARKVRGKGKGKKARSFELLRRPSIIENPALIRRSKRYVLLVSQGLFARCTYRTLSYRSRDLRDWSRAEGEVALDRSGSGLCGPGGADIVEGTGSRLVFFHSWTCGFEAEVCRSQWHLDNGLKGRVAWRPQRSLYVGGFTWHKGHPRVRVIDAPPTAPPPEPEPSPTPTPTPTPTPSPTPTPTPTP